jgi:membrane-bound metal-dependent hydrolase YbcI (DUF457 family)
VYAVGHLALGYITGRIGSKATKTNINLPLIFALSILPDIDLVLFPRLHRGPTHSLVLLAAISIPFLIVWRLKTIPYVMAYAQHLLIGDMIAGATQYFWPISFEEFGLSVTMGSPIEVGLEWAFFLASLALMIALGDFKNMLKPSLSNLVFIVPCIGAGSLFVQMRLIILPFLMQQISYYNYSTQLIAPQVFYFIYFLLAVVITVVKMVVSGVSGKIKTATR